VIRGKGYGTESFPTVVGIGVNVNMLLLRSSASCKELVFDLGCITDVYEVCRVQSLASRHGNMKMYRRPNLGLTPTTPEDDSDGIPLVGTTRSRTNAKVPSSVLNVQQRHELYTYVPET
jgi:hypothetical protein